MKNAVVLAGLMQIGILIAGLMVPGKLNWKVELAGLSELSRKVIWVHSVYIFAVIALSAGICLFLPTALLDTSPLARVFCAFFTVFWGARIGIQLFAFDASAYLTSLPLQIGFHCLTISFLYLTFLYGRMAMGVL